MTTNWALPTNIEQYSETGAENVHVSWDNVDNFSAIKNLDGRSIKTSRDLLHIARDPKHDILEKTYYLRITGFNFVQIPEVISGIEAKITMKRHARITDDTIQLTLNDLLIGENQADLNLDPIKTYGSSNNYWNASLTSTDIQNSSFGIVLRFQSHPRWPHKTSALIDSVELRIH
jgi:hypothetical protein